MIQQSPKHSEPIIDGVRGLPYLLSWPVIILTLFVLIGDDFHRYLVLLLAIHTLLIIIVPGSPHNAMIQRFRFALLQQAILFLLMAMVPMIGMWGKQEEDVLYFEAEASYSINVWSFTEQAYGEPVRVEFFPYSLVGYLALLAVGIAVYELYGCNGNRAKQLKIGLLNSVVMGVMFGILLYLILQKDRCLLPELRGDYLRCIELPVMALVCNLLANVLTLYSLAKLKNPTVHCPKTQPLFWPASFLWWPVIIFSSLFPPAQYFYRYFVLLLVILSLLIIIVPGVKPHSAMIQRFRSALFHLAISFLLSAMSLLKAMWEKQEIAFFPYSLVGCLALLAVGLAMYELYSCDGNRAKQLKFGLLSSVMMGVMLGVLLCLLPELRGSDEGSFGFPVMALVCNLLANVLTLYSPATLKAPITP